MSQSVYHSERPSAQALHEHLRKLQQGIFDAPRLQVFFTEPDMDGRMAALGLYPQARKVTTLGTVDVDYGLPATGERTMELFFHCAFTKAPSGMFDGHNKHLVDEPVALYATIYVNPMARGGWPIDPATGRPVYPPGFDVDSYLSRQEQETEW